VNRPRVALVDYGAGNLRSVRKGLAAAGADVVAPAAPADLDAADGIVLPGVGHFGVTSALDGAWRRTILDCVGRGLPLLGICLGLQLLFDGSDEAPDVPGLSLIPGRCRRLEGRVKVPHVGWNTLARRGPSRLLADVDDGAFAYFTHSYAAPITRECVAAAAHGVPFAAVVEADRLFGVQFHPEKSAVAGLRILANFVGMAAAAARGASSFGAERSDEARATKSDGPGTKAPGQD
jgi:imidazole glycerol phosphate synthase glutamine amidotransferase subunit